MSDPHDLPELGLLAGARNPRGERCSCGRPAVLVLVTRTHGEIPWCGSYLRLTEPAETS